MTSMKVWLRRMGPRMILMAIVLSGVLGLTSCRARQEEWAVRFNGIGDHAVITRADELEPAEALTVEFWFKPDGAYSGALSRDIVRKCGPWESGFMFRWHRPGDNDLVWILNNIADGKIVAAAAVISKKYPAETTRTWHHFAGTYSLSDKQTRLFIDGELVGQSTAEFRLEHTSDLYLMYQPKTDIQGAVAGTLREFRFSNVARYNENFTPAWRHAPDSNTRVLLHMDSGEGAQLFDAGGRKHHAKLIGGEWVRVSAPEHAR